MPIYDFKCPECEKEFEAMIGKDDDGSELECPGCGRTGPEKLLSAVQFKVPRQFDRKLKGS